MMSPVSHQRESLPRIDVRLRISALWISTMLLFAYVDLFSLYRPDFRAAIEDGRMHIYDIGQPFLLGVTLYVLVPSVMIYLTLVLPTRTNRVANIAAAAVYAATIAVSAIGEWGYFVLGSVVEAALLFVIVHHAWTWSSQGPGTNP